MASRPPSDADLWRVALLGQALRNPKTAQQAWRNAITNPPQNTLPPVPKDKKPSAKDLRDAQALAYAKQSLSGNPIASGIDSILSSLYGEDYDRAQAEMVQNAGGTFNESIDRQGGWGASPEVRKWLGADDSPRGQPGVGGYLRDVKRPVQNLVANAADLGWRALEASNAGIAGVASVLNDVSDRTGASDALSYDGNKFQPGSAIMALQEAIPDLGYSHGINSPMANKVPGAPRFEPTPPNPREVAAWWSDKKGKVDKTPVVDDATGDIVGSVSAEKVAPSVDGKRRPYTFASETDTGKTARPLPEAVNDNEGRPYAGLSDDELMAKAEELVGPLGTPKTGKLSSNMGYTKSSTYLNLPDEPPYSFSSDVKPNNDTQGQMPVENSQPVSTPSEYVDGAIGKGMDFINSPEALEYFTKNSPAIREELDRRANYEIADEPSSTATAVDKKPWETPTARSDSITDATRSDTPDEPVGGVGEPPAPIDTEELVNRLTGSLKGARKLLPEQAQMYTEARKAKLQDVIDARATTSGEEGLAAELAALKGELPKKSFEDVKEQFTQPEIEHLFNVIKEAPQLGLYTSITARKALGKLLEGQLPTKSEIALLQRVLPKEFIEAALSNRSNISKILDATGEVINVPRALMASFDLSAPFRQGLFLTGRKEFWNAWGTMFKSFGSERAYKAVMDDIHGRPNADLYDQAGLSLADAGHIMGDREEAFMSNWAEKIPVIGRGVRASDRAYTAFLNKVRADTFDTIVDLSRKEGIDVNAGGKPLTDIAKFVNAATGRGSLGKASSAAPALNAMFFSPRLIASRVQLLNPAFYVTLSPVVRREAIKSLITTGALATTVLGLAAASGLGVEADPRSSDFGKIVSGNTRFDILGGFGQYITLGARLATNQTKGINGGDVQALGQKFGQPTRLDVLGRFARSKLSPVAGFVGDYLAGKDYTGQPFDVRSETAKMFVPLLLQDVAQTMKENGPVKGGAMAVPGVFGVGVNTYNSIPPAPASIRWNEQDLPLDRQAQNDYQEKVQAYYDQNIQKLKDDGDWDKFSKNDQNVMTKAIIKEGKKMARESMLPTADDDTTPTVTPGQTMFDGFSGIPQSVRRTVKGNEKVGGVAHSDHLKGDAVDFTPQSGQSMAELEAEARKYFPGTYILNEGDHIHVRIPGLNGPLYGRQGTAK